jgi:Fe-S-cluster containining protein
VEEEYVFPNETDEGFCIFHDKSTRKCRIHSVKPETCVAGPITFDINKKTGKIEWFIKMDKICGLAGIVYRDEGLLCAHLENAKRELLRLVDELGCEELRAILKKDEPETFKIGEDPCRKGYFTKDAK